MGTSRYSGQFHYMNDKIPLYIINLKKRNERKKNIYREFHGRNEFNYHIIQAHDHKIGAIGLWDSIREILQNIINNKGEFVILCEDDHQFTIEYSRQLLCQYIEEAKLLNADILSGGISGFTSAIQVSTNLYWVEKFSGLQFTVIFRKIFQRIIDVDFGSEDAADYKMCELTENKFFIYPFISVQKDFGYSDVTPGNNQNDHVGDAFKRSSDKVQILKSVSLFYENCTFVNKNNLDYYNITIPVYVINLPERNDRKKHIEEQFQGKTEFDMTIIEACRNEIGAIGLWQSICKIIKRAIEKDEDVIIICEDDHTFTSDYRKEILIENIFQAHIMGCNFLVTGVGGFNTALPIIDNLWWVDFFWCTQFIVIYKKFYSKILNEPFNDTDTADGKFSEMTSQKIMMYPFISVQKDFGYSDVTFINNETQGLITQYFQNAEERLRRLQRMRERFNINFSNPSILPS